jgi:hypothetical protein
MEFINFFGYDEDGEKHEPQLLDNKDVEERVAILKDVAIGLGNLNYPTGWEIKNTKDRYEKIILSVFIIITMVVLTGCK